MKHTRALIFIFSFALFLMSDQVAIAQMVATPEPFGNSGGTNPNAPQTAADDPGSPVDEPPGPCTSPDVYCPIDGGVAFLIAAGIGLAGRRAHQQKKLKSPFPTS